MGKSISKVKETLRFVSGLSLFRNLKSDALSFLLYKKGADFKRVNFLNSDKEFWEIIRDSIVKANNAYIMLKSSRESIEKSMAVLKSVKDGKISLTDKEVATIKESLEREKSQIPGLKKKLKEANTMLYKLNSLSEYLLKVFEKELTDNIIKENSNKVTIKNYENLKNIL